MKKKLLNAGTLVKVLDKTTLGHERGTGLDLLRNRVVKIDSITKVKGIAVYDIQGWFFMPSDVMAISSERVINPETQKGRILKLLKKRRWVKVQELHEIAWRYGACLCSLRKDGHMMIKRRQKDSRLEEWKLL